MEKPCSVIFNCHCNHACKQAGSGYSLYAKTFIFIYIPAGCGVRCDHLWIIILSTETNLDNFTVCPLPKLMKHQNLSWNINNIADRVSALSAPQLLVWPRPAWNFPVSAVIVCCIILTIWLHLVRLHFISYQAPGASPSQSKKSIYQVDTSWLTIIEFLAR